MPPRSQKHDDQPAGPSGTVRTYVSLWLVIHLFCVGVALSTTSTMSPMHVRLRQVLNPYTQLLHLDGNGVQWAVNDGGELDVAHYFEIELTDGPHRGEIIVLPDRGWSVGQQRKRFRRIGRAVAYYAQVVDNDNAAALIAGRIAAPIVRQYEATRAILRCRSYPSLDSLKEPSPRHEVYVANVIIKGDEVAVIKASATGLSAPLKTEGKTTP